MNYETLSQPEIPPLLEHPMYRDGMAAVNAGRWPEAVAALELLLNIYPDTHDLAKLLEEARMRATMARFQPKHRPKRIPRRFLAGGLLVLVVLLLAGFGLYKLWLQPILLQELAVRQVTRLRTTADEAIARGDYRLARQSLEQLQLILPEDPETASALQRTERLEKLTGLYDEASRQMAAGNWNEAITALTELESLDAEYRDLPQLLAQARQAQNLNKQFEAAEAALSSGDYMAAIAGYQALQEADFSFRYEDIQAGIFEGHLRYGQQLLAEAGSNPEPVSEALAHFDQALKLQPANAEALAERRLAESYLRALTSKNRDEIIDQLQIVVQQDENYAGKTAVQLLYNRLSERAASLLAAGDRDAAIADYQLAARLGVADATAAQEKLAELVGD